MNKEDYFKLARSLAGRADVTNGVHRYFEMHRDRLWDTLTHFDLLNLHKSHVLEIGPFYSYTPFLLQKAGNQLSVLEGDDPAAYPLKAIYDTAGINFLFCDLFDRFGDTPSATHRLPYEDNQFDAVLCWETMEHFNFNPAPFVQELRRILKPGGRAYITVPNLVKLDKRVRVVAGKSATTYIQDYIRTAGQKYYGFHWREYTLAEIKELFAKSGFKIHRASHLHTFQNYVDDSRRAWKRALIRPLVKLCPSFGALCAIVAEKNS